MMDSQEQHRIVDLEDNAKAINEGRKLDVTQKQNVAYCIPTWLRDEQIKIACDTIPDRLQVCTTTREEPIACVSYGPSLNETWEKIRDFQFIMTCSGAHKFLVERGIIPTHHLDVDPREHKIQLMGPPQQPTEYLMASTCHPKMWQHLKGYKVKLWHIFDSTEEGIRQLPHGEWAVMGGCSAGLRTITVARFLGFKKLHIFGMDGCDGPSGKHAAAHPKQAQGRCPTEYKGVTYYTTPAFLESARQTFHELDMLPDVVPTFYGTGLVQEMAKDWIRKSEAPKMAGMMAFTKPELISSEYRELNVKLHHDNLAYGVGGGKHAKIVKELCEKLKTRSVLDYGCGKGYLAKELDFPIWEYDPAIPGKEESPRPADLVVCTDVLEHIEPDRLNVVLHDLRRCVKQIGYFVVHNGPAVKTLPDGRNTHLIQKEPEWWRGKLCEFFVIPDNGVFVRPGVSTFIVTPKKSMKVAA